MGDLRLVRLAGPWGAPAGGARLLLLSPEGGKAGPKAPVVLLTENVGDADRNMFEARAAGRIEIDGVAHPQPPFAWNGTFELSPNDVWVDTLDLSELAPSRGRHRVRYESNGARSNEIEIEWVPE